MNWVEGKVCWEFTNDENENTENSPISHEKHGSSPTGTWVEGKIGKIEYSSEPRRRRRRFGFAAKMFTLLALRKPQ